MKVSESGSEGVTKVKEEVDDMFPFLAWLDPFYRPRKTSSNLSISVESESEVEDPSCDDDTSTDDVNTPEKAGTSMASTLVSDTANNFRPAKKALLHSTPKAKRKINPDVSNAEVEVLQSIGAALGQRKSSETSRDEEDIFGAQVASLLRQLPPEKKVMVQMQVSNILYQEVLSSLPTASGPTSGTANPFPHNTQQISWNYPHHSDCQPLHTSQVNNQSLMLGFLDHLNK